MTPNTAAIRAFAACLLIGLGPLRAQESKPLVRVEGEQIRLLEKIRFRTGKATIRPESFRVLDQLAALLANDASIRQVEIQSHTDGRGSSEFNRQLTQDRASAVRQYLVDKGIAPGRLTAVGYGETRPIHCEPHGCPQRCRRIEVWIRKRDESLRPVQITSAPHSTPRQTVRFRPGSTRLDRRQKALLKVVAEVMADYPDLRIKLLGHEGPGDPKKRKLALGRAQAVKKKLVALGVAPERLVVAASERAVRPPPTAWKVYARGGWVEFEVIEREPGTGAR
ncbi:MAG: OmpA family protein [Deltaproteobacteria bacterium]|nr:OmpA family protein [Deltaproteobacteria bacterium]